MTSSNISQMNENTNATPLEKQKFFAVFPAIQAKLQPMPGRIGHGGYVISKDGTYWELMRTYPETPKFESFRRLDWNGKLLFLTEALPTMDAWWFGWPAFSRIEDDGIMVATFSIGEVSKKITFYVHTGEGKTFKTSSWVSLQQLPRVKEYRIETIDKGTAGEKEIPAKLQTMDGVWWEYDESLSAHKLQIRFESVFDAENGEHVFDQLLGLSAAPDQTASSGEAEMDAETGKFIAKKDIFWVHQGKLMAFLYTHRGKLLLKLRLGQSDSFDEEDEDEDCRYTLDASFWEALKSTLDELSKKNYTAPLAYTRDANGLVEVDKREWAVEGNYSHQVRVYFAGDPLYSIWYLVEKYMYDSVQKKWLFTHERINLTKSLLISFSALWDPLTPWIAAKSEETANDRESATEAPLIWNPPVLVDEKTSLPSQIDFHIDGDEKFCAQMCIEAGTTYYLYLKRMKRDKEGNWEETLNEYSMPLGQWPCIAQDMLKMGLGFVNEQYYYTDGGAPTSRKPFLKFGTNMETSICEQLECPYHVSSMRVNYCPRSKRHALSLMKYTRHDPLTPFTYESEFFWIMGQAFDGLHRWSPAINSMLQMYVDADKD